MIPQPIENLTDHEIQEQIETIKANASVYGKWGVEMIEKLQEEQRNRKLTIKSKA